MRKGKPYYLIKGIYACLKKQILASFKIENVFVNVIFENSISFALECIYEDHISFSRLISKIFEMMLYTAKVKSFGICEIINDGCDLDKT